MELPVTLTTYGSLKINDDAVLELDRGEAYLGTPFNDEDELLEHLAVNLIGTGRRLSSLDGWADLSDDAVDDGVDEVEAQLHREMAR